MQVSKAAYIAFYSRKVSNSDSVGMLIKPSTSAFLSVLKIEQLQIYFRYLSS